MEASEHAPSDFFFLSFADDGMLCFEADNSWGDSFEFLFFHGIVLFSFFFQIYNCNLKRH